MIQLVPGSQSEFTTSEDKHRHDNNCKRMYFSIIYNSFFMIECIQHAGSYQLREGREGSVGGAGGGGL